MRRGGLVVPPGPRSRVPGRLELRYLRDPLGVFRELSSYGGVAHMRFRSLHVYLVSDPELIQRVLAADHRSFVKGRSMQESKRVLGEGLLTSEGDFHHSQRRLLQPAFHRARIEALGETMVDIAERAVSRWPDGQTLDMHVELSKLTVEVVGQTLLSTDLEREAPEIVEALAHSVKWLGRMTLPMAGLWERSPARSARRFREAIDRLDRVTAEILERRRARPDARDDALSFLLEAQAAGTHGLTDREVRDEAITMLLAGHETTANMLTWTLYLLWQHPEAERRVLEELDAIVGDRRVTTADAARLTYIEQVLHEALRLYPPVWTMARLATEDYELAGYTIPEGSIVAINQWVTQHDPRFFPDPFAFDPDRWNLEARALIPRYAFFPFGGGPRICLGPAFALLEGKLVLATLLRRWSFRLAPGQRIEAAPTLTLRPKHGVRMTLAPRVAVRGSSNGRTPAHRPSQSWDAAAELWSRGDQKLWRRHSDTVNARLVERWLPMGLRRILKTDLWDEAVGDGLYGALAARAEVAIGVDVSPGVVRSAKARHPGLEASQADVRRLPFDDASFDAAFSNSTLDHFDSAIDIVAALRELHRVLEPGGRLVLTLDNPHNPFVALTRMLPRDALNRVWIEHAHGTARVGMLPYYVGITLDRERLRDMLLANGFDVEQMGAIVHAPRALATLAGAFVERANMPRASAGFARALELCERLERLPTRFRTGHFTAVLATRR